MKLKITCILLCLSFSLTSSFGQLLNGEVAPDFTLTDIDGVEHNLYDILDDGKLVVLDIMATWCEPCWIFHNNGVLDELWEVYGPDGTDEMVIFMIEGDENTTLDQLNGIGMGTEGDWTEGTHYPIIDAPNSDLINDYEVVGFPTPYIICPDKRLIYDSFWEGLSVESVADLLNSCPSLQGENNATVFGYTEQLPEDCGAFSFSPEFAFQNLGESEITNSVMELYVDGNLQQTLDWVGEAKPYQVVYITFDEITLSSKAILELKITSVNGQADEDIDNNSLTAEVPVPTVATTDSLIVEIQTDDYGAETYWAILNDQGEIVAEGGNLLVGFENTVISTEIPEAPVDGTEYMSNTLYRTTIGLPSNGCYSFVVTDYYEDGMCCEFGEGYFKLLNTDEVEIITGVETIFDGRIDTPFGYESTVSINNISEKVAINLLGNPITDVLRFSLDLENNAAPRYEITNSLGQVLHQSSTSNLSIGKHNLEVDVSSFAVGTYALTIYVEDGIKTVTFIKK